MLVAFDAEFVTARRMVGQVEDDQIENDYGFSFGLDGEREFDRREGVFHPSRALGFL